MSNKGLAFYDMEIYRNWCCINIKLNDRFYRYEHTFNRPAPQDHLAWFMLNTTLVGFNNQRYDDIMILMMYHRFTTKQMYDVSQRLIVDKEPAYKVIESLKLNKKSNMYILNIDSLDTIDIMNVLVGKAGLKLYGARVHYKKLQELPIPFDQLTTWEQQRILVNYCDNDVGVTEYLHDTIKGEFDLRIGMGKQYDGIDLRSKSGPQIAEILLVKMCEQARDGVTILKPKIGVNVPTEMRYDKPYWIKFKTDKYKKLLSEICNDTFYLNEKTGHLILGDSVKDRIFLSNDCSLKMGIGGLHAVTMPGARFSSEEYAIEEQDFASLYPHIIVNSNSYPLHFGVSFFDTYKYILASRLEDKHAGRKLESNSKKLILNSSFGQFSSMYSRLYAPQLLLNTTLSGQLTLLMLIERVELQGFNIFTANTDSITLIYKRNRINEFHKICDDFSKEVNIQLEGDFYSKYIQMNVNNYFAVYE